MKIELTPKNALIIASIVGKYDHLFDITTLYADGNVYKSVIKPEKYVDQNAVYADIQKELDRYAGALGSEFCSKRLLFKTSDKLKALFELSDELISKAYLPIPSLDFLIVEIENDPETLNDKYAVRLKREPVTDFEKKVWQALMDISEGHFYDNYNIPR